VGGEDSQGPVTTTDLFDEGRGAVAAWEPALDALDASAPLTATLDLTGLRLTGLSDGGSGNRACSSTNYPILLAGRLDNGQREYLPVATWGSTAAVLPVPEGLQPGPHWVRAVVNGIPSDARTTVVTEPTCWDGYRDGEETDLDCGGPDCASRCADGSHCEIGDDCESGVCLDGTCQAPRCDDGVVNGEETGEDCGGATCPGCGTGQPCASGRDCLSFVCVEGACQAATCEDGVLNQDETALDPVAGAECGGALCAPCPPGLSCEIDSDCLSSLCVLDPGLCTGFFCCAASACDDQQTNGSESGPDCGG